jgi:hypothetical protein
MVFVCVLNITVFGVVFSCVTINYCFGVVFNTTMCQPLAKIYNCFILETLFPIVGGYPKIRMESPNTRERIVGKFKYSDDTSGDKKSPKDCSNLKSCECFYTCPRAPFYRDTKGLLHSGNTLGPKEYS